MGGTAVWGITGLNSCGTTPKGAATVGPRGIPEYLMNYINTVHALDMIAFYGKLNTSIISLLLIHVLIKYSRTEMTFASA